MKRCDYCGKKLRPPRKRFCCNKHKDRYHNEHNPRGIYAHLNPRLREKQFYEDIEHVGHKFDDIEDSFHSCDSYSLGQE